MQRLPFLNYSLFFRPPCRCTANSFSAPVTLSTTKMALTATFVASLRHLSKTDISKSSILHVSLHLSTSQIPIISLWKSATSLSEVILTTSINNYFPTQQHETCEHVFFG